MYFWTMYCLVVGVILILASLCLWYQKRLEQSVSYMGNLIRTRILGKIWKSPSVIFQDPKIKEEEGAVQIPDLFYRGPTKLASFADKMIWNQVSDLIAELIIIQTSAESQKVLTQLAERGDKIGVTIEQIMAAIYSVDKEYNGSWH